MVGPMAQEAFILWFADEGATNLSALNSRLTGGRQVVFASAMSGTGEEGNETPQSPFPYSRATVVLDQGTAGVAQEAFVLWFADDGATNLGALNGLLAQNWRIVNLVAMSGTGEHGGETPQSPFPYSRALAVLQR
jgi:hypothetical protein